MGIIFLVVALTLYVLFFVLALPHKINKRIAKYIRINGIMHLTSLRSSDGIMNDKIMYRSRQPFYARGVYFFQNGSLSRDAIEYNKNRSSEVKIVIKNLTEEQIKKFRVRYYDMALFWRGDFTFDETNSVTKELITEESIDSKVTNLFF